jgi:hypothetical protein
MMQVGFVELGRMGGNIGKQLGGPVLTGRRS